MSSIVICLLHKLAIIEGLHDDARKKKVCGHAIESWDLSQCLAILSARSLQSRVNWGHSISTYLHKAVANETHQQLLPPPLFDQRGVLSAVHAREVKHGHVRLARVVLHKLKVGQFVTCGKVGCIVGIAVQSLIIHVRGSQQVVCIAVVLQGRSAR